jgi:hypothetical protein
VSDEERDTAELTRRMADLGARDPRSWALSEIREGIAQQARYLVLRRLWSTGIDGWHEQGTLRRIPAAARLLAQGANPVDVGTVMRFAAYEAAFTALLVIEEGYDPDAPADAPGWTLQETDGQGNLTGRRVGALHEDLIETRPSRIDVADLGM